MARKRSATHGRLNNGHCRSESLGNVCFLHVDKFLGKQRRKLCMPLVYSFRSRERKGGWSKMRGRAVLTHCEVVGENRGNTSLSSRVVLGRNLSRHYCRVLRGTDAFDRWLMQFPCMKTVCWDPIHSTVGVPGMKHYLQDLKTTFPDFWVEVDQIAVSLMILHHLGYRPQRSEDASHKLVSSQPRPYARNHHGYPDFSVFDAFAKVLER